MKDVNTNFSVEELDKVLEELRSSMNRGRDLLERQTELTMNISRSDMMKLITATVITTIKRVEETDDAGIDQIPHILGVLYTYLMAIGIEAGVRLQENRSEFPTPTGRLQ